ncbi:uncharacterized protein LOC125424289 [Ziziphus jujuba]|uniref:Uncharacterized protein LOC125424289 n=2 Tax=Ziziphus jujuba TaxID=326968 RepID=A0ABM3IWZ2_ZIZJJ|nr:uncharacterized protein LOC125424289 [Ziziphus jujuba]KAH7518917.1 hypothetical protein FEM48_Zijuj09G0222000 [Ziziphus jujuba var. spinosa]
MESSRKRRGFIKGKLMPFYRAAKPSSTVQYTSKVIKPSQSSPSASSVGYVHVQDYVISGQLPTKKVSFMLPENSRESTFGQLDGTIYGVACDEAVDMKAASYISSVQERFKLERINSERPKCQDIH